MVRAGRGRSYWSAFDDAATIANSTRGKRWEQRPLDRARTVPFEKPAEIALGCFNGAVRTVVRKTECVIQGGHLLRGDFIGHAAIKLHEIQHAGDSFWRRVSFVQRRSHAGDKSLRSTGHVNVIFAPMRFIGIDVHKKHSQICILDAQGAVESETRVPITRPDLADVLRCYLPARIVLEASTPAGWVARHLESLGFEVIVADPGFAPMYATRDKRLKTDKRDARALAQAAQLGACKAAHRLSDAQRTVRTRVQVRQALVQMRTKIINQLGAQLLGLGYPVGSGAAEQFEQRLGRLELPPELSSLLAPLVSMLGPLNERIEQLDKELTQRARQDEQAARLQQIPGVVLIVSLMFLAVLDRAGRVHGAHQVMSYLGLVPREKSSGEKQRRGHITKAGHRQMRVLLVQAALGVMRLNKPQTERLPNWTEKLEQRRGKTSPKLPWRESCVE